MKNLRGRETVGYMEMGREREKEGEGKALTSCGNTHFSHELMHTRKVIYSIPNTQGEKESTQCVHCLKRATGDYSVKAGNTTLYTLLRRMTWK